MTYPRIWYHGSPYCCLRDSSDFEYEPVFLTDSKPVAMEYFKTLLASGRKPNRKIVLSPTLYVIELLLEGSKIFDTRKDNDLAIFHEIVRISKDMHDPDDSLRKSDLISVHAAIGSRLSGRLPLFGKILTIMELIMPLGFEAIVVAEGSQGASLAVMNPSNNLNIIEMIRSK